MKIATTAENFVNERTPYSLVKLGKLYSSIGRYEEAIKHFNEAILMQPNEFRFYFLKGVAEYNMKLFSRALANFKLALQPDPINKYEILNYIGTIRFKLGDFKQGLHDLEKVIGYYKGDMDKLKITKADFAKLLRMNY